MRSRIFKSRKNKVIGGVCGGLGEYFNIDPVIFRILFIAAIFIGGLGFVAYFMGLILLPYNPDSPSQCHSADSMAAEHSEENANETERKPFPSEVKTECKRPVHTSLFAGGFFILIGIWLLLYNIDLIPWNFDISRFFSFWPLSLVMVGLVLLPIHKSLRGILISLMALLWLAAAFFSEFTAPCCFATSCKANEHISAVQKEKNLITIDESAEIARLELEMNACKSSFASCPDHLLSFTWGDEKNIQYALSENRKEGIPTYEIEEQRGYNIKSHSTTLSLNPSTTWALDFDVNAADLIYNLSEIKVKSLNLEANASHIDLTLGDKCTMVEMDIESNASSVVLRIPKSVGCMIYADNTLSMFNAKGFTNIGGGKSETANYNTAAKRINIHVDGNVSDISVQLYD